MRNSKHLMIIPMLFAAGCIGPYKQEILVEIGPNETAFKVPLEGQTSAQEKAQSEEYLKQNQVFTKRVSLAQRQQETGRVMGDFIWIPSERVIKVNRTPVTREWTDESITGTSSQDQGLPCGSRDSIAFHVNATFTGHIEESDAAKFAYHWGGDLDHERGASTRMLETVIDTNIRSFAITELQKHFGKAMLMDGIQQKEDFFEEVFQSIRKEFSPKGITCDFFGLHGNITFIDDKIQETLNKRFITENEKLIAVNQTLMQAERNKQKVSEQEGEANMQIEKAKGESESKKKIADGEAYAIITKAEAEAKANRAKAAALEGDGGARLIAMAQIAAWKGEYPQWWMSNGSPVNLLLNTPIPDKK